MVTTVKRSRRSRALAGFFILVCTLLMAGAQQPSGKAIAHASLGLVLIEVKGEAWQASREIQRGYILIRMIPGFA
jgi:hypothetical protein